MPPQPPFTLSVHGEHAIRQLQQALGSTTRDDLIRLFRLIEAHEDLVGLHEVLPRLARVAPWLDLLWTGPIERYAGLAELAAALCRPEIGARWRDAVPKHRSSRGNVANSLTGQLDRYPHYAVYTEFPGDRSGEQEARVAPLIALYTLLSNAGRLSQTLANQASRRIRRLLDPSHAEARALRARFPRSNSTSSAPGSCTTKSPTNTGPLRNWLDWRETRHRKTDCAISRDPSVGVALAPCLRRTGHGRQASSSNQIRPTSSSLRTRLRQTISGGAWG